MKRTEEKKSKLNINKQVCNVSHYKQQPKCRNQFETTLNIVEAIVAVIVVVFWLMMMFRRLFLLLFSRFDQSAYEIDIQHLRTAIYLKVE